MTRGAAVGRYQRPLVSIYIQRPLFISQKQKKKVRDLGSLEVIWNGRRILGSLISLCFFFFFAACDRFAAVRLAASCWPRYLWKFVDLFPFSGLFSINCFVARSRERITRRPNIRFFTCLYLERKQIILTFQLSSVAMRNSLLLLFFFYMLKCYLTQLWGNSFEIEMQMTPASPIDGKKADACRRASVSITRPISAHLLNGEHCRN